MPDPNDTTQTPPAASPAAPAEQPAAPVTFTAEQVVERERAAAQKAHDAAMAEARRVFEGKQKAASTAQQQPAQQPTSPQAAPVSGDDFGRVRAYERTLARYDFTDDALAMLDERFATEKPADVAGWVGKMATAFRVPQRGATTPPATSTPPSAAAPAPQAAPAGPPVTGNGAPSSAVRVTDDVPLINRSPADQDAFREQHGIVAFTDRIRKEATQLRTAFRLPRGG